MTRIECNYFSRFIKPRPIYLSSEHNILKLLFVVPLESLQAEVNGSRHISKKLFIERSRTLFSKFKTLWFKLLFRSLSIEFSLRPARLFY